MIKSILQLISTGFSFLISTFTGILSFINMSTTLQTFLFGFFSVLPVWISTFITLGISISIIFLVLGRT